MTSFSVATRILHWLIALHMLALIPLGWWMVDLTYYSQWYNLAPWFHKMFGVLVFVLGLALLIVKHVKASPPPLENHTAFEKTASKFAHWVLLTAVITIPISGYVFTTATGDGIDLFGLATLPALFPVSEFWRDVTIDYHIYASYGLLAVIAAHVGGALKHHFVDRDQTLRRMISS